MIEWDDRIHEIPKAKYKLRKLSLCQWKKGICPFSTEIEEGFSKFEGEPRYLRGNFKFEGVIGGYSPTVPPLLTLEMDITRAYVRTRVEVLDSHSVIKSSEDFDLRQFTK